MPRRAQGLATKPLLVGTWAAAERAIALRLRNGFTLVAGERKDALLRKYWSIPERQTGTSIVLEARR